MKRFSIIFVVLLLIVSAVNAQDILFSRNYGHSGVIDNGYCGDITSDGGFIIGGGSNAFTGGDLWLVRCDASGDAVWTRNYGGDRWQMAYSVIETDDGGFAACGENSIASGDDDLFIVRTFADGNPMWTRNVGVVGENDKGREIIQTADRGFLALGQGHNTANNTGDLFMVKVDSLGNPEWTRLYGYGNYRSEYGYGAVQLPDGGFTLTGTYAVSSSSADIWLLRTDGNGDTLWTRTFDFHTDIDRGDDIALAPDGGFAIAGRTRIGSYYQLLAMKTDSLGNLLWWREFGGADTDFAESIDITADGGFVICGGGNGYPYDYYVVRVGSNGDSLWAAFYDYDGVAGDSEDSFEIRVYPGGDIMVFGYADVQSGTGADNDYWAVKLNDSTYQAGCEYVVGDVNGSDSYNGLDITYGVAFFKGGADPICPFGSCSIPPCDTFFYCGDVNGSCTYNGLDITYGVAYFKGGSDPIPCPDCPPMN
ncbi:MAG: hypothetical protein JSU85_05875 [Candidatus Zixiibacteriota bacterium]|nr:MAG: hypothetical protein JSU85_05875 [candidate division Zixibacteria bacterium]